MKKIVLTTLLATTGALLLANTAEAKELPTTANTSDVSLTFQTDPINTPDGPFQGALSFTWKPSSYNFGKQVLALNSASYDLAAPHAGFQWVVVNEDRVDSDEDYGQPWNVKASMSDLSEVGGTDVLTNGKLTLEMDSVKHYNMGTKMNAANTDIDPAEPNEVGAVTEWDATHTAPTDIALLDDVANAALGGSLVLEKNEEVNVLAQTAERAVADKKREGYASNIKSANISFATLDKSVADKTYAGTVTWTLERTLK